MERRYLPLILVLLIDGGIALQQYSINPFFYDYSCPTVREIVRGVVEIAVRQEPRMAASLLRLHFHDCFVNGCDGSVLLDNTKSFKGEKSAGANANSLRGFEVVDAIKAQVEKKCPGIVSCADILAMAARDSVALSDGPSWEVELGRRDSLSANRTTVISSIPSPTSNFSTLIARFEAVGLSLVDMVALSGAHSIGQARCATFRQRLFNQTNTCTISKRNDHTNTCTISQRIFFDSLKRVCPLKGNPNILAPLDFVTPAKFDNRYYFNLQAGKGIFDSDNVLFSNRGVSENYVRYFSYDQNAFFDSFVKAMIKMGRFKPLTGKDGEIRRNCRRRN